jgi:uncharacterized protein YodC (DUF2158 family)
MLGYARVLNTTRGDLYEHPLQAGELVQLKSGGPLMVVTDLERDDGVIAVVWHDKLGAEHNSGYRAELLRRARRSFFSRRR